MRRILGVIIVVAALVVLSLFVVLDDDRDSLIIIGDSMSPTLTDGQTVEVEPGRSPRRFEIVHYEFPLDPEKRFIGRVVGVPGDTVEVRNRRLYVNGSVADESYIAEPTAYEVAPVRLGPDEYFVLGDNRNNSSDSHIWGVVPVGRLLGVVIEPGR